MEATACSIASLSLFATFEWHAAKEAEVFEFKQCTVLALAGILHVGSSGFLHKDVLDGGYNLDRGVYPPDWTGTPDRVGEQLTSRPCAIEGAEIMEQYALVGRHKHLRLYWLQLHLIGRCRRNRRGQLLDSRSGTFRIMSQPIA